MTIAELRQWGLGQMEGGVCTAREASPIARIVLQAIRLCLAPQSRLSGLTVRLLYGKDFR